MHILYHYNGNFHWIQCYWGYESFTPIDTPTIFNSYDVSYMLVPGTHKDDCFNQEEI